MKTSMLTGRDRVYQQIMRLFSLINAVKNTNIIIIIRTKHDWTRFDIKIEELKQKHQKNNQNNNDYGRTTVECVQNVQKIDLS